jgi:hypothetical protein
MPNSLRVLALVLGFAALTALGSGCNYKPDAKSKDSSSKASNHGHDHDDHEEGPHGGHLVELAGPDGESAHAEWLHDDETNLVTVFLLGEDAKSPLKDAPPEITIEIRGGKTPTSYTLPAIETYNDAPVEAAYAHADPLLLTGLRVIVESKEPQLKFMQGEAPWIGTFEHHDHDHHH